VAKVDLKELAMRGAAARVSELREELAGLYQAFPALRKGNLDDPFSRRTRGANAGEGSLIGNGRKRKRRGMTAAQKAEVSKRMKKYWAARRKAAK
jgi:hypothetical protein